MNEIYNPPRNALSSVSCSIESLLEVRTMSRSYSTLITALSCLISISHAMECLPPRGNLPTVRDCRDLTDAIAYLARLPGENNLKTWGRRLPSTPDTQKVPKIYWIVGRGPTTCAVRTYFSDSSLPQSPAYRSQDMFQSTSLNSNSSDLSPSSSLYNW